MHVKTSWNNEQYERRWGKRRVELGAKEALQNKYLVGFLITMLSFNFCIQGLTNQKNLFITIFPTSLQTF